MEEESSHWKGILKNKKQGPAHASALSHAKQIDEGTSM